VGEWSNEIASRANQTRADARTGRRQYDSGPTGTNADFIESHPTSISGQVKSASELKYWCSRRVTTSLSIPFQMPRLLLDVALPMSRAVCTNCRRTGRLLEDPADLPVEFYACDKCGHVWTKDKSDRHTAKEKVAQPAMKFRVVQPWGQDKGRQGTVQSEHKTVAEAFAALDSIASDMAQTGVPSDAIELVVVDEHGQVVPRPGIH
jgi:hypothetical protein